MFTFRFRGEKIASVKTFMDSKYVTRVIEEETKARKEKDSWSFIIYTANELCTRRLLTSSCL